MKKLNIAHAFVIASAVIMALAIPAASYAADMIPKAGNDWTGVVVAVFLGTSTYGVGLLTGRNKSDEDDEETEL